jgi:hypothetical protein
MKVAAAERRIRGDDDSSQINACEIQDCELAAIRKHDGNAVVLVDTAAAEIRSQGAGRAVKFTVGDFATGCSVHQEDMVPATLDNIRNHLPNIHFPIVIWSVFVSLLVIASPADWVVQFS